MCQSKRWSAARKQHTVAASSVQVWFFSVSLCAPCLCGEINSQTEIQRIYGGTENYEPGSHLDTDDVAESKPHGVESPRRFCTHENKIYFGGNPSDCCNCLLCLPGKGIYPNHPFASQVRADKYDRLSAFQGSGRLGDREDLFVHARGAIQTAKG